MSRSVLYMSMSVDGYIAAPNDGPGNPGGMVEPTARVPPRLSVDLLPLVFAFAEAFIDLKAGLLGVRDGQRLELVR